MLKKLIVLGFFMSMALPAMLLAYSGGPPNGYANDPPAMNNCTQCHSSFPLNSGNGMIELLDLPEVYEPGETYQMTYQLSDPSAARWGFEMTVLDGGNNMAGDLMNVGNISQTSNANGREYLKHTSSGTFRNQANSASWQFNWTAPMDDVGAITFYLAGNAANNNFGTSGDRIYATTVVLDAAAPPPPPVLDVPIQANYFELVSTNILPVDLNAASIFGDIENLAIVYQDDGGLFLPPALNTIGEITPTLGYQVFATSEATWTLEGSRLNPDAEFSVQAGPWNWIGYPLEEPVNVEDALAEIADVVTIVMTDDGGFWIPEIALNTLGSMEAGEGYMIITTEDVNFTFNAPMLQNSASLENRRSILPTGLETGLPYVVLLTMSENLLSQGATTVELLDQGQVVGSAPVEELLTPVVAWGGSAEMNLQGFIPGHPIEVRVLDEMGNSIPMTQSSASLGYGTGAYAELHLDSDSSDLPGDFRVSEAFPNPFNPSISVPFHTPHEGLVEVTIFNTLGQQVFGEHLEVTAGTHRFQFDITQANQLMGSGMYFVQMLFDGQRVSQKIMLMK